MNVKLFLSVLFICFFGSALAIHPTCQHRSESTFDDDGHRLFLIQPQTSPHHFISLQCANAFEWTMNCELKKINLSFVVAGLGHDDRTLYLYDSQHLFYKPETRNNAVDLTCSRKWEVRLCVLLSLQSLFSKS